MSNQPTPTASGPLASYVLAVQHAEALSILAGAIGLSRAMGVSVSLFEPADLDRRAGMIDLDRAANDTAAELGAERRDVLAIGGTARQVARAMARREGERVAVLRSSLDREVAGLCAESGQ